MPQKINRDLEMSTSFFETPARLKLLLVAHAYITQSLATHKINGNSVVLCTNGIGTFS